MCRKLVLGSNPDEFAFLWPGSLGWRTALTASCGFFESHTSEQKTGSKLVLQGFQAALREPSLPALEFRQDARAIRGVPRGLLAPSQFSTNHSPWIPNVCMSQISISFYEYVCTCLCGECTCVYRWGMFVCVCVCVRSRENFMLFLRPGTK